MRQDKITTDWDGYDDDDDLIYENGDYDEDLDNDEVLDAHVDDPLKQYLKKIGRYPLLTSEEEIDLAKRIEDGSKARDRLASGKVINPTQIKLLNEKVLDGKIAKEALTNSNTRLVVSIAKKYWSRTMKLIELIQEGNIGLMRAVIKFDHRRGFRFSTYATWWIRQAITRGIADKDRDIRIPVHMNDRINNMIRISREIEQTTGSKPSNEALAEILETETDDIEDMWRYNSPTIDLETPVGEDSTLGDFLATDEKSPFRSATQTMLEEDIAEVLANLSPRQAVIIRLRFGLGDGVPHTLEEIANKFGLSRERIRQLEKEALRRLKHPSIKFRLVDYMNVDES